jgi:plasmid stabilization system protein ParE
VSLPVGLRPEAQADVQAARDWYEQQRAGLGSDFTDAVDEVLTRIAAFPGLYAVVWRDVRRAKIRRFPYVVYYRVLADRSEVLAVLHSSRDPRVWQGRAQPPP